MTAQLTATYFRSQYLLVLCLLLLSISSCQLQNIASNNMAKGKELKMLTPAKITVPGPAP